jgi:hypothetical protein
LLGVQEVVKKDLKLKTTPTPGALWNLSIPMSEFTNLDLALSDVQSGINMFRADFSVPAEKVKISDDKENLLFKGSKEEFALLLNRMGTSNTNETLNNFSRFTKKV